MTRRSSAPILPSPEWRWEPTTRIPDPTRPIVILGGYGQVGRGICRLLSNSNVEIRVAGRRPEQAARWIKQLTPARARFLPRYADLRIPETLPSLLMDAGLAILAATADEHVKALATACLAAGCDCVDLSGSRRALGSLRELDQEIRGERRLFVTQAGCCPGLPSLLARTLASQFDDCHGLRLGTAISLEPSTPVESVAGIVDAAAEGNPCRFYWRARRDHVAIDYGYIAGPRLSLPLELPELEELPANIGVHTIRAYAATPGLWRDCAFRFLVAAAYRAKWGLGRRAFSKLLLKAASHSRAAPGIFLNVEGWGVKQSVEHRCTVRVFHPDIAYFTAAAAVLLVRQYLQGKFAGINGLNMMGHIMDHSQTLLEMRELGISVERTSGMGLDLTMRDC